jgi:serine/threonine protein phosphatase PrpC
MRGTRTPVPRHFRDRFYVRSRLVPESCTRMGERLVAEVNENGGRDNVTAVVGVFTDA